ncbi:hypothetical protein BYT27DRAFT_7206742 [Phlegmacium glaucopus]|nr:hypothetical protein BYT27DRAFT_7206742 [Phlegmacium glaucopus]
MASVESWILSFYKSQLLSKVEITFLSVLDSTHLFNYARIIGIFHVDVTDHVPQASLNPTPIKFLWIILMQADAAGFEKKHLNCVELLNGQHNFLKERLWLKMLGKKTTIWFSEILSEDVHRFVDCDMYMCYPGDGTNDKHVPMGLDKVMKSPKVLQMLQLKLGRLVTLMRISEDTESGEEDSDSDERLVENPINLAEDGPKGRFVELEVEKGYAYYK